MCCRNDFRMTADTILKLGAGHDLITVNSMGWSGGGNEVLSVRSGDLVSGLQHAYTADSHKFPPTLKCLHPLALRSETETAQCFPNVSMKMSRHV